MKRTALAFIFAALFSIPGQAQTPPLLALGDSITEGVQSADSSARTQPYNWASLLARQMGVALPLPLIQSGPFTEIDSTMGRSRINPLLPAANLAVSGATVGDLLDASLTLPIDTETDLVLMPRSGSQIQIAERLKPPFTAVWIGANDVDGAVLAWDNLDASQMTPVDTFTAEYAEMISRLSAWGGKVVVANIPDVTQIGFVVSPQDLVKFLGSDFGLPQGSYTTLPTMLLIKLGYFDGSILQNPSYVLDPTEFAAIQQRAQTFNQIIATYASQAGMAEADIYGELQSLQTTPPVFYGVGLTVGYQGGLLSLDGVHPSDIGHALSANAFINAANQKFGLQIPLLTQDMLNQIAAADPFIDWNQNLVVRGRPLAGLLETLGPILGISGDYTDTPGAGAVVSGPKINPALGEAFKKQYLAWKGLPANTPFGPAQALAAMKEIFAPLKPSFLRH